MTRALFDKWLSHFINVVNKLGEISSINCLLFILHGQNSHVTIHVIQKARDVGLDLLILLFFRSHMLQPLDVTIFKPIKTVFHKYKDVQTLANKEKAAHKEILTQWVSVSLHKAMSSANVKKGFATIGIYHMAPWLNKDRWMHGS